jgi:exonuclease SbcC
MKILKLGFKNLNSLYGEWHVDFEAREYAENMIFALTGPTGSGKTTILDAICLALYGRTPRLGSITRTSNGIMSRGAGECWAEVTFLTKKGLFKSRWEQRRARKHHEGDLQRQKHQIYRLTADDGSEGELLAESIGEAFAKVVEVVGMNFEQFTKAVMLAQGEFNTFLKADSKDKSSILEQITGTKIYTELSVLAYYQMKELKTSYENKEVILENIKLLTEEEEQTKVIAKEKLKDQQHEHLKHQNKLQEALNWRLAVDKLEKEVETLANQRIAIEKSIADFFPNKKRLELAKQASLVEGSYATYVGAKEALMTTESGIVLAQKGLEAAMAELGKLNGELKGAQEALGAMQKEHDEGLQLITEVRLLDNSFRQQEKQFEERLGEFKAIVQNEANVKSQLEGVREVIAEVERQLERGHVYEKEHENDRVLAEKLGVFEARFKEIVEQKVELEGVQKELEGKVKERGSWVDRNKKLTVELEEAEKQLESLKRQEAQGHGDLAAALNGKSLEGLKAEEEQVLEQYLKAQAVVSLEEHRRGLREGEACPLCGALEHPFAAGVEAEVDELKERRDVLREQIRFGERQLQSLDNLRRGCDKALADYNEKKLEAAKVEGELKAIEKEISEGEKKVAALEGRTRSRVNEVNESVSAYEVQITDETDFEELFEMLNERRKAWQANEKDLKENEGVKIKLATEVSGLDKRLVELQQEIATKSPIVNGLEAELNLMGQKRLDMFGEKKPDEEEKKLKARLGQAVEQEEKARMAFSLIEKEASKIGGKLDEQKANLAAQKPALERAKTEFEQQIGDLGFENEDGFLEARMEIEVRRALEEQERELEHRAKENAALLEDKSQQVQLERAKALTDEGASELGAALEAVKEAYGQVAEAIGKIRSELEANVQAKETQKETLKQVEAARAEYLRWAELSDLMGTADGSKFRKFAQSLTFELLMQKANQQLVQMMPRYILKNGGADNLELFVIDNYQAGEVRSTNNLSGGESFIVCLALALGLANMTGQQVNVDSLFLDEGFGSLDEKSLGMALDSLGGLMQKGKIIGIISHVAEIKQRIPNQIEIKSLNGRSQMSGPGVTRGAA